MMRGSGEEILSRRQVHYDIPILSSSPTLPSLDDLVSKAQKKPPLRSGSRAAPIPDDAVTTFRSAAAVWRAAQEATAAPDLSVTDFTEPERGRETSDSRFYIELSSDLSISDTKNRSKSTTANPEEVPHDQLPARTDFSPISEKPWRKFRRASEPIEDEEQEVVLLDKRQEWTRPPNRRKKVETAGKPFTKPTSVTKPAIPDAPKQIEAESIQPAIARRLDWTPPPEDAHQQPILAAHEPGRTTDTESSSPVDSGQIFKTLQTTFAYDSPGSIETISAITVPVLRKRKKVDTVPGPQVSNESEFPSKPSKMPKKKPRTITELAMAAYVPGAVVESPVSVSKGTSVLDELPPGTRSLDYRPGHPAAQLRKGFKSAVQKTKPKRRQTTRKNVLLSPGAALQQTSGQDFVFGTSSQLAREESPTTLRDLQTAIRVSSQSVVDLIDQINSPSESSSQMKLWAAGTRGENGAVLGIEVIDLLDSPHYPKDPFANDDQMPDESRQEPVISRGPAHEKTANDSGADIENSLGADVDNQSEFLQAPASNQELAAQSRAIDDTAMPSRPKYDIFTDAQLAKEVNKYGFKPVKKRTAMIALLDKCWTSKHSHSNGPTAQVAEISSSATTLNPRSKEAAASKTAKTSRGRSRGRPKKDAAVKDGASEDEPSTKRPRGRPKKATDIATTSSQPPFAASMPPPPRPVTPPRSKNTVTQPVLEISDSESEDLFSSPEIGVSSPPAVDMSITEDDTEVSLAMSPTSQESLLFGHITKAVKSAPRSKDPLNPSWHEKMLMYDPIVLEDFAAWLNAGHLDLVGYDGEVSATDAKKWCESKSICCLWKVNLRGKERKRF
jgi:hypothetical protein